MKTLQPCVIWLTGLSASGKTTIANSLQASLRAHCNNSISLLDGDKLRAGLNRDLGYTPKDRSENIRRVAEVAKLMLESGSIVIVALISPQRSDREAAKLQLTEHRFVEVFVDTPAEECLRRDPKGLYKKFQSGELKNFVGFDLPYEAPAAPDIHVKTVSESPAEAAHRIMQTLIQ